MTTTFLRQGVTAQTMLLITGQHAAQGAILNVYDSTKSYFSLALDHAELLALLRALPTALLLESLGERGFTAPIDLDDTPKPGDDETVPERVCPPVPSKASADIFPTSLLVEVLGERGMLCTMGGEAPDVAAGLDALAAEQQEERCDERFTEARPAWLHIETGEERPLREGELTEILQRCGEGVQIEQESSGEGTKALTPPPIPPRERARESEVCGNPRCSICYPRKRGETLEEERQRLKWHGIAYED